MFRNLLVPPVFKGKVRKLLAVTSDRKNASYGPNVTLAVTPEDDYRFDNLAVTGAGGGSWSETKPCPNIFCHGGEVDCFYCGGDGVQ